MAQEVERLQAQQAQQAAQESQPSRLDETIVRGHHEKHLALVATLDELRKDLEAEQSRSRSLEQRATAAEQRLAASGPGAAARDPLWATSRISSKERGPRSLEETQRELADAEDEAFRLREELNREKERNLQRKAAWKEELHKITEELTQKQRLEDEVLELRRAQARLREELENAAGREAQATREAARLQDQLKQETLASGSAAIRAAELDALNVTGRRASKPRLGRGAEPADERDEEMQQFARGLSDQLMCVEQELARQVQRHSHDKQLLELFLQHVRGPLTAVRQACWSFAAADEAGRDLRLTEAPPLPDQNSQDLQDNLVKIVEVLRYSEAVFQARDLQRRNASMFIRSMEDAKGHAREWFNSPVSHC
eukprot:TRINITY_DN26125_c0_g1_i1.p1 TRINITY_DN26125_c0_g1~~TRINITY_DN26125_c0_g1_i1.p1  ORF type:complete len:432 (-),score=135.67 TRINITY_DN26125_c0_g1_i1:20-1132(-)